MKLTKQNSSRKNVLTYMAKDMEQLNTNGLDRESFVGRKKIENNKSRRK